MKIEKIYFANICQFFDQEIYYRNFQNFKDIISKYQIMMYFIKKSFFFHYNIFYSNLYNLETGLFISIENNNQIFFNK